MDLTEAEDIKKRWQEYTEELYKKDLHHPDNHDGVPLKGFGARPSHRCLLSLQLAMCTPTFSHWPWVLPFQHHFQSPEPHFTLSSKNKIRAPSAFPNGDLIKFKVIPHGFYPLRK